MSQMQELLDKATEAACRDTPLAVSYLIDAIKLLSRGQQQVMQDLDRHRNHPSHDAGMKIGSAQ